MSFADYSRHVSDRPETRSANGRSAAVCRCLLLLAPALLGPFDAYASAPPCSISQLTATENPRPTGLPPTGDNGRPFISGLGTRIVFVSSADPVGANPNNIVEVFLIDTVTGATQQLTTRGFHEAVSDQMTINGDGTRMAYASDANLTGENSDGNLEIFLIEPDTGTFKQITNDDNNTSGAVGSFYPTFNRDGTRLVFHSSANLTGTNPNRASQIVLFDASTNTFTEVATLARLPGPATISGDGTRVAFVSWDNLNGPDGNSEVFLFDSNVGTLTQIASAGQIVWESPSINFGGTRIAFRSRANLTGENAAGDWEMFLFDTTTATFTQLTKGGTGEFSTMNAAGTRIAFASRGNLTGDNPDLSSEIFLFDTRTGVLTQITNASSGIGEWPPMISQFPSMNASGTRIAFQSTADLTGQNTDRNQEIFVAVCLNFSGTPGRANCHGESVAALVQEFGDLPTAASTFGFSTVRRLQQAIRQFCTSDVYPILNDSITLGDVTSETQGGEFLITATFTNTGNTPIRDPFFEVMELSGGNELANADSDFGGVGATLTPDIGDGILSPGKSTTVTFRIRLASFDAFSFFVNVRGAPEPPQ